MNPRRGARRLIAAILSTRTAIATAGLWACCLMGCGETRHAGVGVVKFADGVPLRAGSLELRSLDGEQHYASRIGRDGEFTLTDRAGVVGVPSGEYEAVVVLVVLTEHLAAARHAHGRNVPRRYSDYFTSGLRVRVADDEPIEVVIESE